MKDASPDQHTATRHGQCPNCGQAWGAHDQFCSSCGQSTKEIHRPATALLRDLVSVELGWDAKLWTTLRRLLFKPGALALDLMEGRRRGQVPPVRLYLFISVVYFLLLNFSIHREFDRIGRERFGTGQRVLQDEDTLTISGVRLSVGDAHLYRSMTDAQLDSVIVSRGRTPGAFDRAMLRRAARFSDLQGIEHAFALMIQNLSYLLFLLMPTMGALFWLFFRKRRPYYIDHLFLAVHLHCFFFLVQSFFIVVDLLVPFTIMGIGFLWLLVHLPLAVKRAYGMPWPATIARGWLVLILQGLLVLGAFLAAVVLAIFRM